jgi:glycosyltransferase involved in cell wall biosynthesis
MRALILCTKYPLDPKDRYMTNELAGALVAAGHCVQAVVTDWDAPFGAPASSIRSDDGVDVLVIAPRAISGFGHFVEKASKWTLSSLFAWQETRKALSGQRFDVLICFTPCVTIAAQLHWATKHLGTRNMLFVHDFFPYHHRSIGLVPDGPVFQIARSLEEHLIRRFHVIGCNWPSNIVYLKKHYRIRKDQHVIWTPLWGESSPRPQPRPKEVARMEHSLPLDRKIVVFGGQITEGRGVEDMLAVAALAHKARPDLAFLFVGDGRLIHLIEQRIASGASNVIWKRRIPRDDYLRLLGACDVGLVATVRQVDSSSFPTKTIDYLRASLPIVASVEDESDFRKFLSRWNIGVSVAAGDAKALFQAVVGVIDQPEMTANIARNAHACLEEVFDVKRTVELLTHVVDPAFCWNSSPCQIRVAQSTHS